MKITKRYIPKGRAYGRPGYRMKPTYVTIHNTGNQADGADAEAHARFLEGGRKVSWHYTVDADSIIQHMPTSEQAWHTGTNAGNTQSIGIESVEYPATDAGRKLQAKAEDNTAWLAAKLCHDHGIPLSRVVTHKSWSGKNCPRDILPHWGAFKAQVKRYLKVMSKPVATQLTKYRVMSTTLNLRTSPGGRVISSRKPGTIVTYLGKRQGDWLYVRAGLTRGWMRQKLGNDVYLKRV